jgi:hypothetical protein
VASAAVSWIGSPADFVDTDQIPEESVVRIHEHAYMDRSVGVWLEMAGAAGIMRIVQDSYSAGMTTMGSVVADFLWLTVVGSVAADFPWMMMVGSVAANLLWMTIVVCCLLGTHLDKEYCRHAFWKRPAELGFVFALLEDSKRGTGHDQPEWMAAVDGVMCWEGVGLGFASVAAA